MAANEASAFDILIKITLRLWLLLQFRAWSCSQVWLHHACRVTDPRHQTDRAQGTHMQLPLTPTPPQTTVMSTTSCGHVALAPCPALSLADLLTLTLSLAPLSPGQRASSSPLHSRAAGQWRPRAHWLLPEKNSASAHVQQQRFAVRLILYYYVTLYDYKAYCDICLFHFRKHVFELVVAGAIRQHNMYPPTMHPPTFFKLPRHYQ